jgi:hypothetical protein
LAGSTLKKQTAKKDGSQMFGALEFEFGLLFDIWNLLNRNSQKDYVV